MDDQAYKVVIKGVAEGRDPEDVKEKLASVFRTSTDKAARFLTGKPVLVKKNLDRSAAAKYKKAIERTGAVCAVLGPPPTAKSPDQKEAPPAGPTADGPPANQIVCPKCGFEQPEALTCNNCGIIFDKYKRVKEQKQMAESMGRYYQHSGKVGFLGLILMVFFGAFTALVGGAIYGYVTYYLPWVYLNFIITILFGFIVGFSISFGGKLGHVRSGGLLLLLGLIFGLLAEYTGWVSWIMALSGSELLVLAPGDMLTIIGEIAEEGPWSIFGWTPKGGWLFLFWIIEFLIIVGGATFAAFALIGSTPYCETCRRWIEEKKSIYPLDHFGDPDQLRARLDAGDFSSLLSLQKTGNIGDLFTQIDLLFCPSCRNMHLLSVMQIEISTDSDGKEDRSEDFVVENLIIDKRVFDDIKGNWN